MGKIFEKINNYQDGAFFTPSQITMYMCKESIRLAVVEQFKQAYPKKKYEDFISLKNSLKRLNNVSDFKQANTIINSLKICDPSVGSGHFLVSALNEILVIKSELGILINEAGECLDYKIKIKNDELIIYHKDNESKLFGYIIDHDNKTLTTELQNIQETIFKEKQIIIENCLFGVDINSFSVKICRLRLWIELLKNTYYNIDNELETLPNLDINIKEGNSLISRFDLQEPLNDIIKNIEIEVEGSKSKITLDKYKNLIHEYQNTKNRKAKDTLEKTIKAIKDKIQNTILIEGNKATEIRKLKAKLSQASLFEHPNKKQQSEDEKEKQKLTTEVIQKEQELEELKSGVMYKNAFEWRFEFPEILADNGDFVGFDIVIGNPPYIQLQKLKENNVQANLERQSYKTFEKTGDIYSLFYEKGLSISKKQTGILCYTTSNKWMRASYGESLRKYFLEYTPTLLVDLGSEVFNTATVDTNILLIQNRNIPQSIKAITIKDTIKKILNLEQYVNTNALSIPHNTLDATGKRGWFIGTDKEIALRDKIETIGKPLKEWDVKINYGIKTGLNEAFIINQDTRDKLIAEDPKSAEIIKPILRGRDIKRYGYEWTGLYILQTGYDLDIPKLYPAIYKYLLQFETKAKIRDDKGKNWYNLRACSYYPEFEKEKVVWASVGATFYSKIEQGLYLLDTNYFAVFNNNNHSNYIIGLLNSNLIIDWINSNDTAIGTMVYRHYKYNFENIPIPPITSSNQSIVTKIETLVQKIF